MLGTDNLNCEQYGFTTLAGARVHIHYNSNVGESIMVIQNTEDAMTDTVG